MLLRLHEHAAARLTRAVRTMPRDTTTSVVLTQRGLSIMPGDSIRERRHLGPHAYEQRHGKHIQRASTFLADVLIELAARYPLVQVDLTLTNRAANLAQ